MLNEFFTDLKDIFVNGGAASGASVTPAEIAVIVVLAALTGLVIAAVYRYTYHGSEYSQDFALALIMLCVLISIAVAAIGSNVARAFSFAGTLAIIRFRTVMGSPRDMAFILFSVTAGLCYGIGAYSYALATIIIMFILIIALSKLNAFAPKGCKCLKITIAENMNYEGVFDPVLEKYCGYYSLKKVASVDLGTLFECVYDIEFKKGMSEKAFLDELRCKNGNLNITLLVPAKKIK